MARIRTIKPEFWADEKLSMLDPITRLVFLGLISMADDAGRVVDSVKQLDGALFPNTEDTCRAALDTLASASRIVRYRSNSGQDLIQIANWARHQRVDKPNRHVLPPPSSDQKPRKQQPLAASIDRQPLANESGAAPEDTATGSRAARAPTDDRRPTTSDQRATTSDQRPTTEDRESSSSGTPLLERLATGADRSALTLICATVPSAATWVAECNAALNGMHGVQLSPTQLGEALREYVGNGALSNPNFRHFRAYLARAAVPARETSRRSGPAGTLTLDEQIAELDQWAKDHPDD